MSSIARPPDPCLAAIVLIVRLRAGPRFVFHYPPTPSPNFPSPPSTTSRRTSRAKSTSGKSFDSTTLTSDEGSSSEDEYNNTNHPASAAAATGKAGSTSAGSERGLKTRRSDRSLGRTSPSPLHGSVSASSASSAQVRKADAEIQIPTTATTPGAPGSNAGSIDPASRRTDSSHGKGSTELSDPPWEKFLELKTDVWEKLLCPTPAWHKRRFEVGLNDLSFIGWPVFAKENGMWSKKKTRRKGKRAELDDDGASEADTEREIMSPRGSELANMFDSTELQKPVKDRRVSEEDSKGEMTMFNVVFVLNPPILEYHLRVKEKYDNVIKKFGKGLKSEQERADYVWLEVQKILHIKEKAREAGTSGGNMI